MTSYFHAWWFGTTTTPEESKAESNTTSSELSGILDPSPSISNASASTPPVSVSISTPEETQEAINEVKGEEDEVEDDRPPAFPSLNSIQRSSAPQKSQRAKAQGRSDKELMPPPSLPTRVDPLSEDTGVSSTLISKPTGASPASSLLPPPSSNTFRIPDVPRTSSNTLKLPTTTTRAPTAPSKRREKVALAPGHSPLDWAALKASGQDLRGTPGLMRITPSQLKAHNKRDDAWSAFNGKVYNITPYLSFHPGGEKELMRVAGRDGTKLFALTHAWVNAEFMLDECMVGFFVPEPSSAA